VAGVQGITIALDAMGGDYAPASVINGANEALSRYKGVRFILFGDETRIIPLLNTLPDLKECCTIHHTDHAIANHEKPSVALRKGKGSSMGLAIEAVKTGKASAIVSAGNTGALMAMSKLMLRTLPGIDRPAITSVFPTKTGRCVLLDLGANVDCNSDNLVQFAIMGDAFAKVILGIKSPRVALLNVGEEDTKGSEVVKAAAVDLREGDYPINFCGYVEGDGITEGAADVVVTDGFTGNVALKTAEGTAKICVSYMKEAFNSSLIAKLGGLLAKSALKKMFQKMDPRMHNGAMFLGLNGISVKSHGGTDALGFSNAIGVAIELASNNINAKIIEELSFYEDLFQNNDAETEDEI
jgi:glycerol-3-phosphate acyltransferase PlsX